MQALMHGWQNGDRCPYCPPGYHGVAITNQQLPGHDLCVLLDCDCDEPDEDDEGDATVRADRRFFGAGPSNFANVVAWRLAEAPAGATAEARLNVLLGEALPADGYVSRRASLQSVM